MVMDFSRIRGFLFPAIAAEDDRFHDEMRRLTHLGLRVIGATEIAVAVFNFLAQFVTDLAAAAHPERAIILGRLWEAGAVVLVGLATVAAAYTRPGRNHPAWLLCGSCWLSSAALIATSLLLTPHISDEYIAAHITTVVLVAITAAPLRPLDTFALGVSIWIFYFATFIAGSHWNLIDSAAWDTSHLIFLVLLTMLSTGLAAALYTQRASAYRTQQESLRLTEYLAAAPVRALLSENAISVGRLAAALTHELNTPLGALKSSIDTMLVVAAKQATAPPESQDRLLTMQAELRRSVNNSMERLKNVIARLQRFIDLDHTERQPADLNEMLTNVGILLSPLMSEKQNVKLEFNLRPVPRLTCRAQQLTTVFSSLLTNAVNAIAGEGRVRVSTEKTDSMVSVKIEDNGRGMEETELETIFDPGFRVTSGRVSTGNWSLFSSRQIVFEHGGEIQITSTPGKGTTVNVLLPI
ncbi:MAG TPA: HAMP domain-containing sensor histidine kinase [Bryobacteraceae bacterium]|nr:HAMP domain-containing sensor histidine kinase [Bryobacteraceae bacterium]